MHKNDEVVWFSFSDTIIVYHTKEKSFLTKFYPFIHQDNITEISEKL